MTLITKSRSRSSCRRAGVVQFRRSFGDRLRQRERAAAVLAGHARRAARRRRPRRSRPARASAAPRSTTATSPPSIDGIGAVALARSRQHFDLLRRVVDRQVRRRLEEADLAHPVAADPAGRQVGDAAVGEPEPRVGDVDAAGQHRHADRFDRLDLGRRPATARRRDRESSGRTRRRCRGCARETCRADALR